VLYYKVFQKSGAGVEGVVWGRECGMLTRSAGGGGIVNRITHPGINGDYLHPDPR